MSVPIFLGAQAGSQNKDKLHHVIQVISKKQNMLNVGFTPLDELMLTMISNFV
jgi:uncharacterized protein YfkK (UPF0435 family)